MNHLSHRTPAPATSRILALLAVWTAFAAGCRIWPTNREFADGAVTPADGGDARTAPDSRDQRAPPDSVVPADVVSPACGYMGNGSCSADRWCRHDSGASWLSGVWGAGPSLVFAVGEGGAVMRFDGKGWAREMKATTRDLYGVWGSGPSEVYAVGLQATILRFDGSVWNDESVVAAGMHDLYAVWGAGGEVFAVGTGGLRLRRKGGKWSAFPPDGHLVDLWAVRGSSATDVHAVGRHRTVLHFDGTAWTRLCAASTSATHFALVVRKPGDVLALGDGGDVYDLGQNGCPHRKGGSADIVFGAWYDAKSTDYFTVGFDGLIFQVTGTAHKLHSSGIKGQNLWSVWGASIRNLFVVGNQGVILRRCTL